MISKPYITLFLLLAGALGSPDVRASTSSPIKIQEVETQALIQHSQDKSFFDYPASKSLTRASNSLATVPEGNIFSVPTPPNPVFSTDQEASDTETSPISLLQIPTPRFSSPLLEALPVGLEGDLAEDWLGPNSVEDTQLSVEDTPLLNSTQELKEDTQLSVKDLPLPDSTQELNEKTQLSVKDLPLPDSIQELNEKTQLSIKDLPLPDSTQELNEKTQLSVKDLPLPDSTLDAEEISASPASVINKSKTETISTAIEQPPVYNEQSEAAFIVEEVVVDTENKNEDEAYNPKAYNVPDIELVSNKKIEAFIKMYTQRRRKALEIAITRSAKYMGMIHRIFKEHGLPLNLAYLAIVESNFNPVARSKAQALGLWQFMSYTGKAYGLSNSWWHDDRYDPEKSTIAAANYLKHLHRQFKGDWELALAAYNTGGGRVRRAIRRAKAQKKAANFWSLRLPRETRGYVPAFYAVATIFNNLEAYGFAPAPAHLEQPQRQMVIVPGGVPLKQVAAVLGTKLQDLKELNPNLKRGITPATAATFEIAIPTDVALGVDEYNQLNESRKQFWKYHRVRKGESLWTISRKYQVPIKKIKSFNHMRRTLLRIGQKLMLPLPSDWAPKKYQRPYKPVKVKKIPGLNYAHKVRSGDTLWSISLKYAVTIRQLRAWNPRASRSRYLKIGTKLYLKRPVKVAGLN